MIRKFLLASIALLISFVPQLRAETFDIDPAHTSVSFKIRHLFTKVQGSFNDFSGKIEYTPESPAAWGVEAVVKTTSIDTANEKRDEHLRSKDFFDVAQFPEMTFKSTGVSDVQDNTAKLYGVLTLHGVEREVMFELEIHGVGADPWGNRRAGFTATTKINRKDFGLTWNETLETGQLLVGDDVAITLEVEGIAGE